MAVVDSILVDIKTTPFNEIIPTYINRDKVLYYHKYIDDKGKIYDDLTIVYLPVSIATFKAGLIQPLIVTLSLADFNTLMTT